MLNIAAYNLSYMSGLHTASRTMKGIMDYITTHQSYASLGKRVLALWLDTIILFIPCAVVGQVLPFVGGLVIWFFYAPILEASPIRATLGKYALSIQVTDVSGQQLSLKAATLRNLLKIVSTVILFIGFIFALFNKNKQTLHDLVAHSVVIDGKSSLPIVDTWLASVKELFQGASTRLDLGSGSSIAKLERLQALREKGALTEEEFLEQKRKILTQDS